MIAQELEVSLHMAFVEARQKRHEFITVEHLLLALLDNPTAAEVLRACGANMDELRKNLTQHIAEQTPRIAADREVDTQPSVGWVSTSRSAAMRGVCSAMCCVRFLRSSSMLAPQARSTSAAVGLSSRASSRCSTVMNSWRFCRASTNAMWRLTSSSCAIMLLGFLHHAL